jgi:thiamine biosynthesis protein ThiI
VQTQKFILKFFPEIMVKGTKAKRQMTGQLYNNLTLLCRRIDEAVTVHKFQDRIEVVCPLRVVDETRRTLLNTPGIEQVLEALQFDGVKSIEQIKKHVGEAVLETLAGKTFAVRTRRSGTHDFTSIDIDRQVGGYLLAHSDAAGVRLKAPEVTVMLELIDSQLNIITQKHKGLGGFPLGTQGDILSLMSGGFDSTVASYLTMRRGIKTHFVFFNLGGKAHEIGVKQVAWYLWSKFGASHRVQFVSVPFEGVVEEIFRSIAPTYMGVMLKRLMVRAAEQVADTLEIDALLTGESVAQVSSQTLRNLALIDAASEKLILRPLSTMDKPEIMAIADSIGTRRFAETMPEYCGVISQNPVTHGSFKRVEKEAARFDYAVLDSAVQAAEYLNIDEVVESINASAPVEIVHELNPETDVLIDIRAEDDTLQAETETLKIPFYKLKSEFPKLPKGKRYMLYCDKGVMSQLHAQFLKDEKLAEDIRVYRPEKKD